MSLADAVDHSPISSASAEMATINTSQSQFCGPPSEFGRTADIGLPQEIPSRPQRRSR